MPRSDGTSAMQIGERNGLATHSGRATQAMGRLKQTFGNPNQTFAGIEALERNDFCRSSLPGRPESWVDMGTAHVASTGQVAWSSSNDHPMDVTQQGPIHEPAGFVPSHHLYNKRTSLKSAPAHSPWISDGSGTSIHGSGQSTLGRKPLKASVKHMYAGTSGQVDGTGSKFMGPASSIYHCHTDVDQPLQPAAGGLTPYQLYEEHLKAPIHCHRDPMAQAAHQLLPPHPVTHPCDAAGTKAWCRDTGALQRTVRTDDDSWRDPTMACTNNRQYADPRSLHYITTAPAQQLIVKPPYLRLHQHLIVEPPKAVDPWDAKMQAIVDRNKRDHQMALEAVQTTELLPYRASCPESRGCRDQGFESLSFRSLDRTPTSSDRQLCKHRGFQPTSDRRMTALQTEDEDYISECAELFNCHDRLNGVYSGLC